jgi:hypothetical protein
VVVVVVVVHLCGRLRVNLYSPQVVVVVVVRVAIMEPNKR